MNRVFSGAVTVGWMLGLVSIASAHSAVVISGFQRASSTVTTRYVGAVSEFDDVAYPIANSDAVVKFANARFTVLTPELIRMEWSADGKFEDHASMVFINRRLPVPPFRSAITGNDRRQQLTIRTSALKLSYTPVADGQFSPESLQIELKVEDKMVVWRPGLTDPSNLLGTTRTLDGAVGNKTVEPIEAGLISRAGWALVDDSTRPLFDSSDFRFSKGEKSPWPWVMARSAGVRQDWYFFGYGHNYRKALGDYVRVAGRIPIPPPFALGTWWSRYWAYSDQEINGIVNGFHENDVPLDVFVIDMDWHPTFYEADIDDASGHTKGWTGYSWNRSLFPDPDQFLEQLHADGLKVSLNLHPASGIQPWEDRYSEMARAMGVDPKTQQYIPFNIVDKRFAINYMDIIHHPLERQGIDFWWLDWQQENETAVPNLSPTWWLNYVHFSDQQREGKRPLLFHRWGGLGNHRFQIGFSGDTESTWDTLAFEPWFTATAANVGYAYWSHDIGGHIWGPVGPELYTRWAQFGSFSPILRTHTAKNPSAERRIWAYPEPYSSILRKTFQLRESLQPYLYTEARRTYDTGVAFLHPVYYEWPDEVAAYQYRGEYMFGEQMMVAPVTQPVDKATGLATKDVWIPPGEWIEEPTGQHFTGPQNVTRRFSIEQTPLYLRTGAIIPMQPPMGHIGEKPMDPLIVNIWPLAPGQEANYTVYEDSGESVDYKRGVFALTPVSAMQVGAVLRVQIGPVAGRFPGMHEARGYQLRLHADWPPESVTVNGVPIGKAKTNSKNGWSFEGNTLTTVIPVASEKMGARISIEVRRAGNLIASRGELNGFAGAMTRLRDAYDAMQQSWPYSAPEALIDVVQCGNRLSYHPERTPQEMSSFHDMLVKAKNEVAWALRRPPPDGSSTDANAEKQYWIDAIARANALVLEVEK